jgi:tetratricopeptide (TPR) repeat protein
VTETTSVNATGTAVSLLNRVQARLRTVSFARAVYRASLIVIVLAVIAVLVVRLLGLVAPADQRPEWLLLLPAAAVLLAGVMHRRVERSAAARIIDTHARTQDLFLTLATLTNSAGQYQPLVEFTAEQKAEKIRPVEVVPFSFGRQLGILTTASLILALLAALVPQLDPFGKVEAAVKVDQQKKEIVALRRAAKQRQDQLQKETKVDEERSDEIDNQIEGLKSAFRAMKPKEQQANGKVLQTKRNAFSEQWKMASSDELRKMLSQQAQSQQFGGTRAQKMNEWLKDLQEGKTDQLRKEMDKAQETMQAMMEAKTPEERQKLASQLRKELQDLKKFSSEKASSKELAAALDKALKALDAAAKSPQGTEPGEEMSKEAMQALKESLDLSKAELQELARSAKDLKKLEEALKTLQQAEKLNQQGQMDGEQCEGCQSLADYAKMYREMMGDQMNEGEGMGERGFGKGGQAPEDDSDPEGYKDEKTKTQVQAGKVLLSIKTKEYATEKDFDPDELRQYQDSVTAIKSGVQAAIEGEQVPPGYVDGIKGYFDKLDVAVKAEGNATAPATAPEAPATEAAATETPAAETPAATSP